jgi:hypothetical protein
LWAPTTQPSSPSPGGSRVRRRAIWRLYRIMAAWSAPCPAVLNRSRRTSSSSLGAGSICSAFRISTYRQHACIRAVQRARAILAIPNNLARARKNGRCARLQAAVSTCEIPHAVNDRPVGEDHRRRWLGEPLRDHRGGLAGGSPSTRRRRRRRRSAIINRSAIDTFASPPATRKSGAAGNGDRCMAAIVF